MKVNVDELRRHYASLSDDALRAINREELVEIAQQCYDHELSQRAPLVKARAASLHPVESDPEEAWDPEAEDVPDWVEDAACACTFPDYPGQNAGVAAGEARSALEESGIPCYIEQRPVERIEPPPPAENEYRVLVPGHFHLQATSALDKEIFNAHSTDAWRAHFQVLTDDELANTKIEDFVGGLLDLADRITVAYHEEMTRRAERAATHQ